MNDIEKCLICGSRSYQELIASTFEGKVIDAIPYFRANRECVAHGRIVRCEQCKFAFTTPQFTPAEYQEIYIQSGKQQTSNQDMALAELYRARRLIALVRRFISSGRMLDFGCGQGGFLSVAQGFSRVGFEVAGNWEQLPSDISIFSGDFRSWIGHPPFVGNYFDVITAFDVLEHLADLNEYLSALVSTLRPGGFLIITVPNIDSFAANIFGGQWNSFLLEHLWYFSPHTLEQIMVNHGLLKVQCGPISYGASLRHVFRRIAQTHPLLALLRHFPISTKLILPIPAGLIYGVFKKPNTVGNSEGS